MAKVKKSSVTTIVVTAIGLLIVSIPLLGHHGTGISYDSSQHFELKGVVTEFRYANPHPQLYMDVTDAKGNVEHWGFEIAPNIAQLVKAGWGKKRSEAALAPGTEVTVSYSPSKAGGTVGLLRTVTNAKGEQLISGGGGGGGARGRGAQ